MTRTTAQIALFVSFLIVAAAAQPKPNAPAKVVALDPHKTIVITGGKLLTITHGTIENGELVMPL